MSDLSPLGDQVAERYLQERPSSLVARYRSGKVHLLVSLGAMRAMCGAHLLSNNYQVSQDTVLGVGEVWCYSCLGNALEWVERDRAHAH